jgi:hypothetical protein
MSVQVETAIAQSVMLTETDVGVATAAVSMMQLIGAGPKLTTPPTISSPSVKSRSEQKFWQTSVGRFRFKIDELPAELQLIYELMLVGGREREGESGFNRRPYSVAH